MTWVHLMHQQLVLSKVLTLCVVPPLLFLGVLARVV